MFSKFALFWIENKKLSFIVIILMLLAGIFSRIMLPKQYNPDIVVPAYQIDIVAPGYSAQETKHLIVSPLENKLFEIEGIEHVYGYATKDYASIMVSFLVGESKEEATTRLYDKIESNKSGQPAGITHMQITAIDPDEIPIFSVAIERQIPTNVITGINVQESIQLRKIALEVGEQIKHIANISNIYIIGGEQDNIHIELDPMLAEAKNIDLFQIAEVIKRNNINFPGGAINFDTNQANISIEGSLDTIPKLQKLVVGTYLGKPVYLSDVAQIQNGISQIAKQTITQSGSQIYNSVFLGIAKKKGSNSVEVTKQAQKILENISKELPSGYHIRIIQDEGKVAQETTNMLLINLIQSIIIVVLILTIFMGFKNSLNVAISIPLTLSIIFLFALIVGDNINRITLFALILVLGMLVDDATVVVENVNRHLDMRDKTFKTKIEAIKDAISEVELGVVLSTVTRLFAFGAMFFVTGMMGLYMGPIPKYALIAMVTSTVVALSINPFLTHVLSKDISLKTPVSKPRYAKYLPPHRHTNYKKFISLFSKKLQHYVEKINFKQRYFNFLHIYIGDEPHQFKKRKNFRKMFYIILGILVVLPPLFGIFKMRMLPKSDQNQIYLRLDNRPDANIQETLQIAQSTKEFRDQYVHTTNSVDELAIVQDISYRIGQAPMPDFANTFRGAANRQQEHQISMRINLIDKSQRYTTSEDFVISIRPKLQEYLQKNYPASQMRLLEDPPGPPVRATFLLKISGAEQNSYERLEGFADWLQDKLDILLAKSSVEDIYTSKQRYKNNFQLEVDHEILSRLGLSTQQLAYTVNMAFAGQQVGIFQQQNQLEPSKLILSMYKKYTDNLNSFQYITLTNPQGQKVPLLEVAKLIPTQMDKGIYSDDKDTSVYLYGEMGNNSVIYPYLNIYNQVCKSSFREGKYELEKIDFYGITIKDLITQDEIRIDFEGEWKLTIDTFRDLGMAMIVAFLAIYFMMVAQFKSFQIGGTIMVSFLLGFIGVFPGFTLLFLSTNEYFSATSMIGVIALAGIVVGNAIILVEYTNILLAKGWTKKGAVVDSAWTRLKPIFVTSLTTILGATTILGDPVWSGLARSIIFGLTASTILTPIVIPIFLYDNVEEKKG